MTLSIVIAPKIARLLPRLASPHDGEVIATARAIARTLQSGGSDFHDLATHVDHEAAPKRSAPHGQAARPQFWHVRTALQEGRARRIFSAWEDAFAVSILTAIERHHASWRASPRQQTVLDRLLGKARDAGVRA